MESFKITRTDHSDLEFDGELLEQINTPMYATPDGERGFDLAVYSKTGGGYVASVKYLTTFDSERRVEIADFVDHVKDVENFFFVFAPCEFLDQNLLRQMQDDQRQRLQRSLCSLYDGHLDSILKSLPAHAEHDIDQPSNDDRRPKSRILGLLGLE